MPTETKTNETNKKTGSWGQAREALPGPFRTWTDGIGGTGDLG